MGESLRDALEEAFAESEAKAEDETEEEKTGGDETEVITEILKEDDGEDEEAGGSDEDPEKPVRSSKAKEDVEEVETPKAPTEGLRAPESWKPATREHWAKLPVEVREEVMRREKEISNTLTQTAGARKFAEAFTQTIRPYEHFLRMENANPLQAIDELFRTSAILRVGSAGEKAKMVADIVKRHGVDIEDLDRALVGQQVPDENGKFRELLKSELQPVNQFMQQFSTIRQQHQQKTQTQIDTELAEFSKKEFYGDVRETMADIMEIAANRGQELTLQLAYERAIAMTPEIQTIIQRRQSEEVKKKRRAASSLPSRSSGMGDPADPGQDSVRGAIEAAFDESNNR